jgi:tetratricopeptide (TPR) repeat protein
MTPERYAQVREIFDAALARSSGAEEYARVLCGGDEELYSQVAAMLHAHGSEAFVDRPPSNPYETAGREVSGPVFREGQLVAKRYRIVRYLGRGGMGEVYEAEDFDLPEMKEHVAIKTLLPEIAEDMTMVARFRQEIALSRKVQHPNVCAAFDLSRHEAEGSNPVLFLTMPFLPGQTLAARLGAGRLTTDQAWPLLQQMAEALDAAHRTGVIHRDFKPGNVMLVPYEGAIRAVVTDFGLARRLVSSSESSSSLTAQVLGTLDYMAPELMGGAKATSASDIYALGMVAYRMITGALPFSEETPLAAALHRIKQVVPPPRTILPNLDPKWDAAIVRALAERPGNRFSTAGQFVQALRGESGSITLPIPVITRRRAVAASVTAIAAIAGLVGWSFWQSQRSRPPAAAEALYRTGVDNIHAGAYFAASKALEKAIEAAPNFALAHARLADALLELDMQTPAQQEMLRAQGEESANSPKLDHLQIAAVYHTITRDFDAAVSTYQQILNLKGTDDAGAEVDLGRAFLNAGKPERALESYRRAAEGPEHNPAAWLWLGVIYSRESKPQESGAAFDQAEAGYRLTSNLEGLIEVDYQKGVGAYHAGRLEDSAAEYRKAFDTARLAGNPQQEIRAMLKLSTTAYLTGDADAAEQYAREALEKARANQMETAAISGLINLGNAFLDKRDFAGAEKYYSDALTLARRTQAPYSAAISQLSLASLHDQTGRYDEVEKEARQALDYYQANHFVEERLQALALLGRADYHRGRTDSALEVFQSLLDLAGKAQNRPLLALAHESIGLLYSRQERYPEALDEYKLKLRYSSDSLTSGYARLQCGDALWILGRYDEANAMFGQADSSAATSPQLRISLMRARAGMALSRKRYGEAAKSAREAITANKNQNPALIAELKGILCVSLTSTGSRAEGLQNCNEALTAAAGVQDNTTLVSASLAAMQGMLQSHHREGVPGQFHRIESYIQTLPESQWRAFALLASVDSQYTAHARESLEQLKGKWGADVWKAYIARPDLAQLSWPLSKAAHAIN